MNKHEEIKNIDSNNIVSTYGRFDIVIDSGKGAIAKDVNGKEYIDFAAGIGVNSLGFCDDEWVKAVSTQAASLQHTSNLYYTEASTLLAEKLCNKTGMKKAFFANSGAEANECAIKTARKYGNLKLKGKKNQIITLQNSFHGRTMATVTATGQDAFHKDFNPFLEGFSYGKANDIDSIKNLCNENTCAIMVELIQGEGGLAHLDKDFVKDLADIAKKEDILLIIDEVQTGIGRTGSLFAYEGYDIEPDLVTFAKGVGGGLPIGGVLFGKRTENVLEPSDHGTTYGANPIACAGANVVLDRVDEKLLTKIKEKGEMIKERLSPLEKVKKIHGKGLMIGIELKSGEAKDFVSEAIEKGLLTLTSKDKIRLLPPLTIGDEELEKGLTILEDILG